MNTSPWLSERESKKIKGDQTLLRALLRRLFTNQVTSDFGFPVLLLFVSLSLPGFYVPQNTLNIKT